MNGVIAKAIYDLWADEKIVVHDNVDIFMKKNEVVEKIGKYFKCENIKETIFLDTELVELILYVEENAFIQGFQIGYDLGVGKLE